MLILGIETSSSQVGCALGSERGLLASFAADRGPRHVEVLVPAIAVVLDAAGFDVSDVEGVAVSVGPGLFTGLRAGIATAQALALARGVPVVGVPTLDLVAQAARLADRPIVTVTDARRGEVFYAHFRSCPPAPPQRSSDDLVASPDALVEALRAQGGPVLVLGDGVDRYPEHFGRWAETSSPDTVRLLGRAVAAPSAAAVVEAARPLLARAEPGRPSPPLQPIYVRAPDAAARWVERGGVVGGVDGGLTGAGGSGPVAAAGGEAA